MIKAIDLDEVIPYTCVSDTGKKKTVWKFRHFTYKQEVYIKKTIENVYRKSVSTSMMEAATDALHIALVGADNWSGKLKKVPTPSDNPLKDVCSEMWSEKSIVQIPSKVRDELGAFVFGGFKVKGEEKAEIGEDEAKN